MIEDSYRKKVIEKSVKHLIKLIQSTKSSYPKLKNRITIEQIKVICEFFYDEFNRKLRKGTFLECMETLFLNGLYSAVAQNVVFDFRCLKLNKLSVISYFNCLEIILVMRKIQTQLNPKEKCKVIEFKKLR